MAKMSSGEALQKWMGLEPKEYASANFGSPESWNRDGIKAKCIYSEGDVLYNYGSHFPLAKFLGVVKVDRQDKKLFVLNGEPWRGQNGRASGGGFGTSTAEFQRRLTKLYGPSVSATALRSAGFDFTRLTLENLADWTRAVSETGIRFDTKTKKYKQGRVPREAKDWKPPRQGMFIPYSAGDQQVYRPESNEIIGSWHTLGATLLTRSVFRVASGDQKAATTAEYYLCGLDEGRYFVSHLSRRATTVTAAYAQLKPPEVVEAERAGRPVRRQGEWFFVPTGLSTETLAARLWLTRARLEAYVVKDHPIPDDRHKTNAHHATVLYVATDPTPNTKQLPRVFVTGKVRHRHAISGALTGEHATVDLGSSWYLAVKNTEQASWAVTGQFD